jgi:exodeoxyribonuclease-3
MRIVSWNVNGIRAAAKKGFVDWAMGDGADIICVQETKAWKEQLDAELLEIDGYQAFFSTPERKGYSGVAVYSKIAPRTVTEGFDPDFDSEGRVLMAEYPDFTLLNVYFPNGKSSAERLRYKMDFYESFLEFTRELMEDGHSLIVCGDVNTAHQEKDLARPKENSKVSGFLPEERRWIDRFLAGGFVDTLREFDGSPDLYTYWDLKTRARERNVGWRIDYFFVSEDLKGRLAGAGIQSGVMGSDHCPIEIVLD